MPLERGVEGKKVSKKFLKKFRETLTFKSSDFIEYSIIKKC